MIRALRECLIDRIAERCAERAHHLRHLLLHAEAEALERVILPAERKVKP